MAIECAKKVKADGETDVTEDVQTVKHEESVYACEAEDGTYILYVKSKDHYGPLIEQTLRDLMNEGKKVSKAVLTDADDKLIEWYFKTGKLV